MRALLKTPYQKIQKHKEKGDVKKIVKYLKYKKAEHVPGLAADALGELKDVRTVEPLIEIIKENPYYETTKAALKALANFGDERCIDPIYQFMKKRHWNEAAVALNRLGWKPTTAQEKVHYYYAKDKTKRLCELGEDALETLISILDEGASKAANVLGEIGDKRAVEPLLDALKSNTNDEYVKKAAAEALGKIKTEQAVQPLIAALFNAQQSVSSSAAEALGSIGDSRAVEPLLELLEHRNNSDVILALGKLKDSRSTSPLLRLLNNRDQYIRRNAVVALGNISDRMAIDGLIGLLESEEEEFVIETTITSLEKIRDHTENLDVETESRISEALISKAQKKAQQEDLKHQKELLLEQTVKAMSEKKMLEFLKALCRAYSSNSNYEEMEPKGRVIGERLQELGGLNKMRAMFSHLQGVPGSRTLEMLWNGIGKWQG